MFDLPSKRNYSKAALDVSLPRPDLGIAKVYSRDNLGEKYLNHHGLEPGEFWFGYKVRK